MAQLLSTERPIIEFELSSSTPEDKKWVKAYGRTEFEDIGAMVYELERINDESKATYIIINRLLIDWSWMDGDAKAAITSDTIARLDPVDLLEIIDQLDVNGVMDRLMTFTPSKAKKKPSSVTSPTSKRRKKAS